MGHASNTQVDTKVKALGYEKDHLDSDLLHVLLASVDGARGRFEGDLA
jgi:hypothetical protein